MIKGNTKFFNRIFYIQRYCGIDIETSYHSQDDVLYTISCYWRFWVFGFYFSTTPKLKYIDKGIG